MESKDKFIAFVDILGFQGFVEAAENGSGASLEELHEYVSLLGSDEDVNAISKYGPTICPEAPFIYRNLDFQIAQFSDCVLVSTEVSPAGAINLINHCWVAAFKLLRKGLMCRGHIRRGRIYHKGNDFMGTGYQNAVQKEKNVTAFKRDADDLGTPFVELDQSITDYIKACGDRCVLEIYARLVKEDEQVCALFPFKQLSHSFMIGGGNDFDPGKEKRANDNLRTFIKTLKIGLRKFLDTSNQKAIRKYEHYEMALDSQLANCDITDEMIKFLNSPFPANRL